MCSIYFYHICWYNQSCTSAMGYKAGNQKFDTDLLLICQIYKGKKQGSNATATA